MTELDTVRARVADLTAQRAASLATLSTVAGQIADTVDTQRTAAGAGDAAAVDQAASLADSLRQLRRDELAKINDFNSQVAAAVEELFTTGLDPCDADPQTPLLLLPVRLETRYSTDGTALRVRIYPDDVHIDRLDPGVTAAENQAGQAYWTSLWTGTATETAAWARLVQVLHKDRAAWVAAATTPTNLAARPDPAAATPAPTFPVLADRPRRAPVARALPDRFVVVVQQAGQTGTATGNAVPPEVVVGLPLDDDQTQLTAVAGATLGPGMQWMADYDEAKRIGLGVDVALPVAGGNIDLVLAFGVRSTLAPAAAATELQGLMTSHRYSDGLAVPPQGTATNNTETDRTVWSRSADPLPPPTTATATQPAPASVAAQIALALGIDASTLSSVDGAARDEASLPAAVNTTLWSASWGTFFDRMAAGVPDALFDDLSRDGIRTTFIDDVRGRGPLPALRVGNQPYGLLPISWMGLWSSAPDDDVEPYLLIFLERIRKIWVGGIGAVPALPLGGAVDQTLLDVLSSAPLSLGVRVRSLASSTTVSFVPQLLGLGIVDTDVQNLLDQILWQMLGLPGGLLGLSGTTGKVTRPLGLPIVDDSDPEYIKALLDNTGRQVKSVYQALVELSWAIDSKAVTDAAPVEQLDQLVELSKGAAPQLADQLTEAVRSVPVSSQAAAPGAGAAAINPRDQQQLTVLAGQLATIAGPAGPTRLVYEQPVAALRGTLADGAFGAGLTQDVVSGIALRAMQAWLRAQARLAQTRQALQQVTGSSTADRQLAVTEALDLCSHRLDAWLTAPVSKRLKAMRSTTPTGIQIGAYAWAENITPQVASEVDGGYVVAPTLTHAVTAGVLRSAYLSHNPAGGGAGAFAVDLTSTRTRRALHLLDGIRSGQPLGALLGYRFERDLRESPHSIERFVVNLRALAPLNVGRIADRAEAPPAQAREAIAANNVVDGIALLALRAAGTDIRTALDTKPANNPYLPPDQPWTGPDDTQWAAIVAAMDDIAGDQDSVADLLLAEGVHQLVQGNTARSAAAMDAAAGGDAVPPDPEVVKVPPYGASLTHRLLLVVRDPADGTGGWSTTAPRAVAEPRLSRWLEGVLGRADTVVIQVTSGGTHLTLAAAGLSAMDVVFDAPDQLERRLRAAVPGIEPADLATVRDPAWPAGERGLGEIVTLAGSLRRLIVGAEPALPPAFAAAGSAARRVVAPAAATDQLSRVTNAANALSVLATQLQTALSASSVVPTDVAAAVEGLAAYGIPVTGDPSDPTIANIVLQEAIRRGAAATAALTTSSVTATMAAAEAVFGAGFVVLPVVSITGSDLFATSLGKLDPGAGPLRRFLRDVGSVRVGAGRYCESLLYSDILSSQRALRIAQLAPTGTRGADQWLGLPFTGAHPSPEVPVVSCMVESAGTVGGTDAVAGLILDEWVEVVPKTVERLDSNGNTVRQAMVTAGVAANVERPAVRAPQALLLALSPNGDRWTTSWITQLLQDTLELAKLRSVTLERAPWAGRILPALQEQSWSLQGEVTPDLRRLAFELSSTAAMIQYVKE